MKKLISLLAALAVVTTGTVAFAAETTTEVDVTNKVNATTAIEAGEDGLYSVTASSTADQATILAIKGKTIKVGAIQYINQAPTTEGAATFSFALNDALLANETSAAITDDVYVLTGGDGNVTGAGYIDVTPEASTGFTVSGAVSNYVEQAYMDELLPAVEEVYGAEAKAEYEAAYAATAYLVNLDNLEAYLGFYTGEADSFEYVAKCDVSGIDGTYSFTEIENGTYALVIDRRGALPYMEYVTVENANVTHKSVELLLGDLVGTVDLAIDGFDVSPVVNNSVGFGEETYSPNYDIVYDAAVDGFDIALIIANTGDMSKYNTTLINEFFGY